MSNWSFTGQPDVPAWPKDEAGREVQAVLLTHTFDAPADADTAISLLSAYGIPASSITTRRAARARSSTASPATVSACTSPRPSWTRPRTCWPPALWKKKRKNTPERSL